MASAVLTSPAEDVQLAVHARLLGLIGASWVSRTVTAAAELQIADHLAAGALPIDTLARLCVCDAAALGRLLRAMTSLGLCAEPSEGRFESTPSLALLRSGASRGLRAQALWWGRQWPMWQSLTESVRTGCSARTDGGVGSDADRGTQPAADLFDDAMAELTRLMVPSLLAAYDFSRARRVIDLGGGRGELLLAIAREHPLLTGTIFDLAHASFGAQAAITAAGGASRCGFVAGDFFDTVPAGFDVYLMKSVLHCWPDARCAAILGNVRASMASDARVLLVERLLPSAGWRGDEALDVARMDLHMLLGPGGRERTLDEITALGQRCGLVMLRTAPLSLGFNVIEFAPSAPARQRAARGDAAGAGAAAASG